MLCKRNAAAELATSLLVCRQQLSRFTYNISELRQRNGYHFTHKTAWNIRKDTARGINSMNVYTR